MIGAGDVTEVKNGPGLYQNANCELKAITNRTYEKALDWSARHNGCIVYKTVDELLADPDIQIVYIATTPDVHKEQAIAVANAGKHVYIEKPLFPSYEDALEVMEACQRNGVRAYVAHYRRGIGKFLKAKALIEGGAIGAPLSARIMLTCTADTVNGWRANPAVSGGGHFFEADIHVLDVVDMILGPYESFDVNVIPMPENPELEGAVSVNFKWQNGMVGSGMWCYSADMDYDTVEIYGTKGCLQFTALDIGGPMTLRLNGMPTDVSFKVPENVGAPHEQLIALDILNDEHNPNLCTLEAAMRTLKVTCAAMDKLRAAK